MVSLRTVIDELQYRMRTNPLEFHELLPRQELFKADKADVKCCFGGNRSGKSQCAADCILTEALSRDNLRIWVANTTFQDSIAIQQRKIWDLCPKHRIKYGRYDVVNGFTNRKLVLDNGSIIVFKSYDQGADTFQGDDIDIILLDEEPPRAIYEEARMRLIDRSGKMIISMTSVLGVTDLIADLYEDADVIESRYCDLVGEDLPALADKGGVKFYFFWSTDNHHIDQERLLSDAKLMSKQTIKTRLFGIPLNLSGRIFPKFSKEIHVIDMDEMDEGHYTLYHSLDPHDRKPFAMIWAAVDKFNRMFIIDEYPDDGRNFNEMTFDDKTYDDYVAVIGRKEEEIKEMFGTKEIYGRVIDPNFGNKTVKLASRSGNSSHTTPKKELENRGLYYKDGIDGLAIGHMAVNNRLDWQEKDGEIVRHPTLFVCSKCTNTIRHLSRYAWKDVENASGDTKDVVAPKDKYKDFCDVVRYLTMYDPIWIDPRRPEPEKSKKRY